MSMDVWGKLWEIASSRDASITVDPTDAGDVTLVHTDGTRLKYHWDDGAWHREMKCIGCGAIVIGVNSCEECYDDMVMTGPVV
jgi:hypothetical protein